MVDLQQDTELGHDEVAWHRNQQLSEFGRAMQREGVGSGRGGIPTSIYKRHSFEQVDGSDEEHLLSDFSEHDSVFMAPMIPGSGLRSWRSRLARTCVGLVSHIGDDWVALTILGTLTALIAFLLDLSISQLHRLRDLVIDQTYGFPQYLTWVAFGMVSALLAVVITLQIAPSAEGSGIPQMKTVLKGQELPHFLDVRTLLVKLFGIVLAEGSGLPLGKEGPFVHMASAVADRLTSLFPFRRIQMNPSRRLELLAAACAVGVASNFGAPIGGVLFSIEVTATYFAVRNYWRGFYASVVGAFVFRLLDVIKRNGQTLTTIFSTEFRTFPFALSEMLVFVLIGIAGGLLGSLFVYFHRKLIDWRRAVSESPRSSIAYFVRSPYVYTVAVAFVIATITLPGKGWRFMGLTQKSQINHLFNNQPLGDAEEWSSGNLFVNLALFMVLKFVMTAVAITLPLPAGVFVPVFVTGAALGRFVGEAMNIWFPDGLQDGPELARQASCAQPQDATHIVAGVYAVVGAAALAGSVTHTISTSVIVFELTGQIHHILPVMIAVLVSNGISQRLSNSIYDDLILIRNLPYLPDLRKGESYHLTASKIMNKEFVSISLSTTYRQLRAVLHDTKHQSFPLVDRPDSRIMLGSVHRIILAHIVEDNLQQQGSDSPAEGDDPVLDTEVNFAGIKMDPAPFQLVEQTSLYKIHTLFSLLGIDLAYVTRVGQLVGVISRTEVRDAIEAAGMRALEMKRPPHPKSLVTFERDALDSGA